ncbi:4-hydroxyphenylpyruvate dioxygenase [Coralloluteibacterium stylophorae]|uniref:4-hydroxyphenylpyruvate dioxygenase n=1 Tax=Coralloluteibacterium stylophorae TaxID=1776034 RepID=A0A8J8AY31_9GAMM|nr:4-hydroxyphenylpyruvate dioxygenase [Coralloluteibacterium stylophorae]MBS7457890.1 4-hydroxyphenylpyruvate dioxygenase [Coralloluteibacterium stylophorae]
MSAQPHIAPAAPNLGMQPTTFENPMGIDGFEFVEFAAPDANLLHDLFRRMGFTAVLKHRRRDITVYRQGGVNFLVNADPDSFAAEFARMHGPSACGFAIRFRRPADEVCEAVLGNGGERFASGEETKAVDAPVVKGIGDCMLYLVDRYGAAGSAYDGEYEPIAGAEQNPRGFGLTFIDHLTHNLFLGNMQKWSDYYERLFNFREIRYFDIKGSKTGLMSKAMTAPDGIVRIPLNESSDPKSQINEYLDAYNGEGIQHVACFTDDIYETVEKMREQGVEFLDTPDTYFDVIDQRIPDHGEDVPRLARNKILIDADPETKQRKLLQIFTQNTIGPIFFEIIQRKGNEGFGEGNFQALFESIERDQIKRGVL